MIVSSKLERTCMEAEVPYCKVLSKPLTGGSREIKSTLTISGIRAEIITKEILKGNRIANHFTTSSVNSTIQVTLVN
jgi:hypothetical protein